MTRRLFLVPPLALALTVAACGAFGTEDGGSSSSTDDDGEEGSAEELVLENTLRPLFGFRQADDFTIYLDRLPPGFPEDFPVPQGADPAAAFTFTAQGSSQVVTTFTTDQSADELIGFYEENLDPEVWDVTSVGRGEQDFILFNAIDEEVGGQVAVDQFKRASDETNLVVALARPVEEAETEEGEEQGDFELGEGIELPEGYPEDVVPIYPESTIIQAGFSANPEGGDITIYNVQQVTADDFEPIIEFYEEELEAAGWEVADPQDTGPVVQITFEDPEDPDINGSITIQVFEQDRSLTSIDTTVGIEQE
jgi:hypothetical protein